jgi:hypothetical protein
MGFSNHRAVIGANGTQRAEHPDYEPVLNFKKAKAERDALILKFAIRD